MTEDREYRIRNREWISKGQREYAGRLGSLEVESQKRLKTGSSRVGLRPFEAEKMMAELRRKIAI
jgi:hypothetical protein